MKSLGIIRTIDHLGRIVIPKELRTMMNIEPGTRMEIFTDNDGIVFKKYDRGSITDKLVELKSMIGGDLITKIGLTKCIEIESQLDIIADIISNAEPIPVADYDY